MKLLDFENIVANRYNHLLTMLIAYIGVIPFVEHGEEALGFQLITIVLLLTIIVCLRAVIVNKRVFWVCSGFVVVVSCIAVFCSHMKFCDIAGPSISLMYCVFIAVTIILLIRSMLKSSRVTPDMIVGSICVYLLMGILWAVIFGFIDKYDPGAIVAKDEVSFFYFSFTTLTTLGYGDVVPVTKVAKVFANAEAVTGQIYIAVFIARLVGLYTVCELKNPKVKEEIES